MIEERFDVAQVSVTPREHQPGREEAGPDGVEVIPEVAAAVLLKFDSGLVAPGGRTIPADSYIPVKAYMTAMDPATALAFGEEVVEQARALLGNPRADLTIARNMGQADAVAKVAGGLKA